MKLDASYCDCRVCGAVAGVPCISPTGLKVRYHSPRRKLFNKTMRALRLKSWQNGGSFPVGRSSSSTETEAVSDVEGPPSDNSGGSVEPRRRLGCGCVVVANRFGPLGPGCILVDDVVKHR